MLAGMDRCKATKAGKVELKWYTLRISPYKTFLDLDGASERPGRLAISWHCFRVGREEDESGGVEEILLILCRLDLRDQVLMGNRQGPAQELRHADAEVDPQAEDHSEEQCHRCRREQEVSSQEPRDVDV